VPQISGLITLPRGPDKILELSVESFVMGGTGGNKSEDIEIYRMFRQRIVEEDNLINHRMSWMLWSEAIVFAIWAVLAVPDRAARFNPEIVHVALFLIALGGLFIAIWSKQSVSAAQKETQQSLMSTSATIGTSTTIRPF
jgi:hypothetical protein